ncbi:MAG: beta-ribofuranosylaminobenzene 5-phosphate synthase [Methylobacteriaceae bacterium]|jgi:beta-RFAP synthase|nr:beta-ribofuranosylaminobenzene 5-phosphate synthase [Methylobacteriaceae bacterium]
MIDSVTVRAPARLHLGFLDMNGGLGRRFGSLGLAIDAYETRITARCAAEASVHGPEAERVRRVLGQLASVMGSSSCAISIESAIPAHTGLGSGTQLALAVAAALHHLSGRSGDLSQYALLTRRGARSGAGIGLFSAGGFIVDGGHGPTIGVPPVIARLAFPDSWRIMLVLDRSQQGVSGAEEVDAFAALPQFPASTAGEICRRVLMQILPALAETDFEGFGTGISAIQAIVGDYFAPVQGGSRFKSRAVEALLHDLAASGATGIGQTSWGPTGFAFVPDAATAKKLLATASSKAAEMQLDMKICKALNRGAMIEENTPARA